MCFFVLGASSRGATLSPAGLFRGCGLLVCGINVWWGIFGFGGMAGRWAMAAPKCEIVVIFSNFIRSQFHKV